MYINKFYPGHSFPLGTESTSKSHLRDTEDEFCFHQKWIELILGDETVGRGNNRNRNKTTWATWGHLGHLTP